MDEREELEEALSLLRYTFEELKKIRDWGSPLELGAPDPIQELIWKIGEKLGEF